MKNLYKCNCHWQIETENGIHKKELPTFYVQAIDKQNARDIASMIVEKDPGSGRDRVSTDCQPVFGMPELVTYCQPV